MLIVGGPCVNSIVPEHLEIQKRTLLCCRNPNLLVRANVGSEQAAGALRTISALSCDDLGKDIAEA